ncbi:CoA transferase, partial [Burkholderia cenocepacia]|nr:CoA transferase [Burkholderia cenocepacia]
AQRERTGRGLPRHRELHHVLRDEEHVVLEQRTLHLLAAAPMPSRISAWAVYDVFSVKDDEQIFLAVVSDTQWALFCDAFG